MIPMNRNIWVTVILLSTVTYSSAADTETSTTAGHVSSEASAILNGHDSSTTVDSTISQLSMSATATVDHTTDTGSTPASPAVSPTERQTPSSSTDSEMTTAAVNLSEVFNRNDVVTTVEPVTPTLLLPQQTSTMTDHLSTVTPTSTQTSFPSSETMPVILNTFDNSTTADSTTSQPSESGTATGDQTTDTSLEPTSPAVSPTGSQAPSSSTESKGSCSTMLMSTTENPSETVSPSAKLPDTSVTEGNIASPETETTTVFPTAPTMQSTVTNVPPESLNTAASTATTAALIPTEASTSAVPAACLSTLTNTDNSVPTTAREEVGRVVSEETSTPTPVSLPDTLTTDEHVTLTETTSVTILESPKGDNSVITIKPVTPTQSLPQQTSTMSEDQPTTAATSTLTQTLFPSSETMPVILNTLDNSTTADSTTSQPSESGTATGDQTTDTSLEPTSPAVSPTESQTPSSSTESEGSCSTMLMSTKDNPSEKGSSSADQHVTLTEIKTTRLTVSESLNGDNAVAPIKPVTPTQFLPQQTSTMTENQPTTTATSTFTQTSFPSTEKTSGILRTLDNSTTADSTTSKPNQSTSSVSATPAASPTGSQANSSSTESKRFSVFGLSTKYVRSSLSMSTTNNPSSVKSPDTPTTQSIVTKVSLGSLITAASTATTAALIPTEASASTLSAAWSSTPSSTDKVTAAGAAEGVIILQIRIQRVFISAYNNSSSIEYKTLAGNITVELDRFYRELFPFMFLRCYVLRLWAGSVGVDTQLNFINNTALPNASIVAESLKSAVNYSKVLLDIIPSSITAEKGSSSADQHVTLTEIKTTRLTVSESLNGDNAVAPIKPVTPTQFLPQQTSTMTENQPTTTATSTFTQTSFPSTEKTSGILRTLDNSTTADSTTSKPNQSTSSVSATPAASPTGSQANSSSTESKRFSVFGLSTKYVRSSLSMSTTNNPSSVKSPDTPTTQSIVTKVSLGSLITAASTATTAALIPTEASASTLSAAWSSTPSSTDKVTAAGAAEGVIILQIRIQRVFISAYNNSSSIEYKTLAGNITVELDRFYRELFPFTFLRCYVLRLWAGSVGVDTQLNFINNTALPNASIVAESLKSAVNYSKVLLDIIPSSITAARFSDPCNDYTALDQPWRGTNETGGSRCDRNFNWTGWYRLLYNGMSVRTSNSCVNRSRCGTDITLWLNGSHPKIEDGIVTRGVCGGSGSDCCYYRSSVRVKSCPGNYYVYELVRPAFCSSAYCADLNTTNLYTSLTSASGGTASDMKTNYLVILYVAVGVGLCGTAVFLAVYFWRRSRKNRTAGNTEEPIYEDGSAGPVYGNLAT